MRMNICSCLLALVLGCNVTAEIIHQIVKEEQQVSLRCSHSVEGKVTWSREINGNTVDIFIVDGDEEQRFNDPHKRYGSEADKSLFISRVAVSDSGKYLCNNEAAVELTVIPSGTTTVSIAEKSNVTLTCPDVVGVSHVPTWTREIDGKQQQIRPHVSAVHKYLNIPDVQPGDSGLYYCDGKPAANLNVIKGDQSEREENRTPPPTTPTTTTATITTTTETTTTVPAPPPPTTTTKKRSHTKKPGNKKKKGKDKKKPTSPTTTSTTSPPAANTDDNEEPKSPTTTSTTSPPAANTDDNEEPTSPTTNSTTSPPATNTDQKPSLILVVGIVLSFLLVLLITITVYCAQRCKRREPKERHHIYDEIRDEGLNPTKRVESSGGPSAEYCLETFSGGSNQNEPTYCTIPDLPPMGNKIDTYLTESPYSMITDPLPDGNKTGTPQLNDPTYSLLKKPKVLENNDQYLYSFT
ncbi:transcription initiation factor TFIID subunit 12-like isoform X2 [Thunnus thynnus]|uniref:transcription initiation factor TFIID subunit 12-like isoform X2 n=1 Tax=Thunnus thynnus TaxID=8237 RepID=UPI0035282413